MEHIISYVDPNGPAAIACVFGEYPFVSLRMQFFFVAGQREVARSRSGIDAASTA